MRPAHLFKGQVKRPVGATLHVFFRDGRGLDTLSTMRGPASGLRLGVGSARAQGVRLLARQVRPRHSRGAGERLPPGLDGAGPRHISPVLHDLLARLVGERGQVVACEPDPANLARTKRNVVLGLTNVGFKQAAVGASHRQAEFALSHNTNSHLLGIGAYVGPTPEDDARVERFDPVIHVRSLGLDEARFEDHDPQPDLIKLDIEDAEALALASAELSRARSGRCS